MHASLLLHLHCISLAMQYKLLEEIMMARMCFCGHQNHL